MKNILASRLIVPILAKIFTVIVIVLGLARLLSLKNDTTNEPILCINAQKIEDCECKDVNIDTNGTNRCYNLDLCPNVDIECPPNEYKIALENEDCPICMPNPCSHLQTVVGCSCSSNEIIEISQDLSFCNKEENPCPKISLSDCDSDHRLHFQYELNGNVLSDCPKCVQNICPELSEVDDCVCELKSLQIDGTSYCISVDKCGLNLNPDNSCINGGELKFLNGPNRCPECVQDKCPELSEVDD
ncbi:MAG: hypothetical protein MHPSP_003367, partial [Paramarteilia canceri]